MEAERRIKRSQVGKRMVTPRKMATIQRSGRPLVRQETKKETMYKGFPYVVLVRKGD